MHLTLEADYAVRIIHCLACSQGKRIDAKTISDQTGVTLRFSLKIMRKLVAGGIVRSYKGTHGGYELARDLDDLTLYDVIEIVEGPYSISRCVSPDFECTHIKDGQAGCLFYGIYQEISEMVQKKLKEVKFSQLV